MKYLQQTLNSSNAFLMFLVMSDVGSRFELLRMYSYRRMKPFRTNLRLVINKCVCSLDEFSPWVHSFSNGVMLIEMSKYISSYSFNSISFEFF